MKIEAGRYYKTRNGQKAFVAGIREGIKAKTDCVVGWIEGADIESWLITGQWTESEDKRDLVAEWKEPKKIQVLVVLHSNGLVDAFHGDCNIMGFIASKKVTLTEGEFDT